MREDLQGFYILSLLPSLCPYAEDHKLVFLQQGPLLLVAVSRTPQSAAQLRQELLAVHAQIVSTLTRASVARIFAHKQNYDLRRLLTGSERTLDRLLDTVERDPGALLLGAVRCVPLARALRDALGSLLRRCTAPGLALSLLAVGGRLVTAAQERNVLAECRLDPADLQLLLDWVGAPAFAAGEAWAPVCLPRFNPDGFFYAYVARLDAMPVCLLLLGTDPEAFHDMATCRRLVEDGMRTLDAMRALADAASCSAPSARAPAYSVQAVGAPGLRHFLYKPLDIPDHHRQLPQFTRWEPVYLTWVSPFGPLSDEIGPLPVSSTNPKTGVFYWLSTHGMGELGFLPSLLEYPQFLSVPELLRS